MNSATKMLSSIEGTLAGVAMACRHLNPEDIDGGEAAQTLQAIYSHLAAIRNTMAKSVGRFLVFSMSSVTPPVYGGALLVVSSD